MVDEPGRDDPPARSRPDGPDRGDDSRRADAADGRSAAESAAGEAAIETGAADRRGRGAGRRVVVPDRVYKAVTVFSTLFAVMLVVGGFVVLDGATNRAQAPLSEINPLVALAGIGLMVLGAVTYAFSTRFQAEGMGNAKDDTDEPTDNG